MTGKLLGYLLHDFNLPNPSSCTMTLGFNQPVTETITSYLPRE
jgi:hypothetical protein